MNKEKIALRKRIAQLETELQALMSENEETDIELEKLLTSESVAAAQESLYDFYCQSWHVFETVDFKPNWHLKCICDHLEAVYRGEIQNIIFECPPRCQPGDSLVLMSDGSYKPISDVEVGNSVVTINPEFLEKRKLALRRKRVTRKINSGLRKCLRLHFQDGTYLDVAENHPVYIHEEKDYVKASKVKVGQSCFGLNKYSNRNKVKYLSEEEAFLIGLWLAEGNKENHTHYRVAIKDNPILRTEIKRCAKAMGWALGTESPTEISFLDPVQGNNKWEKSRIYYWFDDVFEKQVPTKFNNIYIPEKIFKSSNEVKAAFISALEAGDGWVDTNSNKIGFELSSRWVIEDLGRLLQGLNFRPTIHKRNRREAQTCDSWVLLLSGHYNISKAQKELYLFQDDDKLQSLKCNVSRENKKIPTSLIKIEDIDCKYRYRFKKCKFVTLNTLNKALVKNKDSYKLENVSSHRFAVITQIEPLGKLPCYDITVEDNHNYFSNNILVHNCSKSSIINIAFPVWCWLQDPSLKFITCAHGESLAVRDAVKSRQLIESPWFKRNWGDKVGLKAGSNQKTKYENNDNGYRIATSISGRAVGEGFDILIVDDPHKPKEINSKAAIQEVVEWWTGTMPSRANSPDSRRVVMHQRLAENDLIGYIRENDADSWVIISLPMLYEPTDYVSPIGWKDPRTDENEVLWKARFPDYEVKRLRNNLGSFGFAAQYQQRPAAKEGGLIKKSWLKYYGIPFNTHTMGNFDLIIQSWDLAFGDTGDFTVGQVWGKAGPDKYLLDEVKGKWTFTEQLQKIRQLKSVWPQTRVILVENKANGAAVIDSLRRTVPGLIPINPKEIGGGDKEVRLSACALDFEAGNIYLPSHNFAAWVKDYVSELTTFPRSKHDDSVDATSQALNWFASKAGNNIAVIPSEFGIESLQRVAPRKGQGTTMYRQNKTSADTNFAEASRSIIDQTTMKQIKEIFK